MFRQECELKNKAECQNVAAAFRPLGLFVYSREPKKWWGMEKKKKEKKFEENSKRIVCFGW